MRWGKSEVGGGRERETLEAGGVNERVISSQMESQKEYKRVLWVHG